MVHRTVPIGLTLLLLCSDAAAWPAASETLPMREKQAVWPPTASLRANTAIAGIGADASGDAAIDTPADDSADASSGQSAIGSGRARRDRFGSGADLDTLPRWEAGVGGGYFAGYDYPASDDPNRRSVALPWFVYRAPIFRADGGGLQAVAIENARIKLDLSLGGSLSASSEGNRVREGLPNLDYLLELGPQLTVVLYDRQYPRFGRTRLSVNTRLRAVISTDFRGLDSRGYALRSGLRWQQRNIVGSRFDFILNLDATAATERLHDYFYEVPAAFVTAERPRYDATGGYLGSTLLAGLAWRPHANWRLFSGLVTGWFDGAANSESPLFESEGNTGYVLGIAWTVVKSADTVNILDTD